MKNIAVEMTNVKGKHLKMCDDRKIVLGIYQKKFTKMQFSGKDFIDQEMVLDSTIEICLGKGGQVVVRVV